VEDELLFFSSWTSCWSDGSIEVESRATRSFESMRKDIKSILKRDAGKSWAIIQPVHRSVRAYLQIVRVSWLVMLPEAAENLENKLAAHGRYYRDLC
jgi:hypothetical protein